MAGRIGCVVVAVVVMVLLVQLCAAGQLGDLQQTRENDNVQQAGNARDFPCPGETLILPCVCTILDNNEMDIDCSDVQSEEELAQVFSIDFVFKDFHRLTIIGNDRVKVLRAGALGPTTYKEIIITSSSLEAVEATALSGSYLTATELDFSFNDIVSFPFDEISSFTHLTYFDIGFNNLNTFPVMSSATLATLLMSYNPLGAISPGALQQLPNLEFIDLENTKIQEIFPGNIRCCS